MWLVISMSNNLLRRFKKKHFSVLPAVNHLYGGKITSKDISSAFYAGFPPSPRSCQVSFCHRTKHPAGEGVNDVDFFEAQQQ